MEVKGEERERKGGRGGGETALRLHNFMTRIFKSLSQVSEKLRVRRVSLT